MICPFCSVDNIEGADECANCGKPLYGLDLPESGKGRAPDFILEKLGHLQKRPSATVSRNDPVALAIRLMQRENIGCVFVMDGPTMVGIITGWDILYKVAGPRADLGAVTCAEIMSRGPVIFSDDDTIAVALNQMSHGDFHHLPIPGPDGQISAIDVDDVFRFLLPHLV